MDEQFAYEKWWVTVGEEDRKLPPECLCPAAWNAAYSLGLAKGRKEGMIEGIEWAMIETRGCADSSQHGQEARDWLVFLAQEIERHLNSIRQAAQGGDDKNHTEDVRGMVQTADRAAGGECK